MRSLRNGLTSTQPWRYGADSPKFFLVNPHPNEKGDSSILTAHHDNLKNVFAIERQSRRFAKNYN